MKWGHLAILKFHKPGFCLASPWSFVVTPHVQKGRSTRWKIGEASRS